jgi:hypothetical protein
LVKMVKHMARKKYTLHWLKRLGKTNKVSGERDICVLRPCAIFCKNQTQNALFF